MMNFLKNLFKKKEVKPARAKDFSAEVDISLEYYSKIFFDTNAEKNEIIKLVESEKIKIKFFDNLSLDVLKKNNDSGYVYYPYYLEIKPKIALNENSFIREISIIKAKLNLICKDIFLDEKETRHTTVV